MKQFVIGTLARRDNEFFPDTGSPTDSNAMEPGVINRNLPFVVSDTH